MIRDARRSAEGTLLASLTLPTWSRWSTRETQALDVRDALCDARDVAQDARDAVQASEKAELATTRAELAKDQAIHARNMAQCSDTLAEREVAIERRQKAQRERDKQAEIDTIPTAAQQCQQDVAEAAREELAHQQGALLEASQSRSILLIYFHFVQSGMDLNPAVKETARVMQVGTKKVDQVRTYWEDQKLLMTT